MHQQTLNVITFFLLLQKSTRHNPPTGVLADHLAGIVKSKGHARTSFQVQVIGFTQVVSPSPKKDLPN